MEWVAGTGHPSLASVWSARSSAPAPRRSFRHATPHTTQRRICAAVAASVRLGRAAPRARGDRRYRADGARAGVGRRAPPPANGCRRWQRVRRRHRGGHDTAAARGRPLTRAARPQPARSRGGRRAGAPRRERGHAAPARRRRALHPRPAHRPEPAQGAAVAAAAAAGRAPPPAHSAGPPACCRTRPGEGCVRTARLPSGAVRHAPRSPQGRAPRLALRIGGTGGTGGAGGTGAAGGGGAGRGQRARDDRRGPRQEVRRRRRGDLAQGHAAHQVRRSAAAGAERHHASQRQAGSQGAHVAQKRNGRRKHAVRPPAHLR